MKTWEYGIAKSLTPTRKRQRKQCCSQQKSTKNHAKGKTVVLNFWASWCPDCRKDAPEVVRLYEKYHQYGVEFIGISMDSDVEAWKNVIEKFGITYPQVSELKKFKETDISKAYGVKWIPSMVVVGSDGLVKLSTVQIDILDQFLQIAAKTKNM